MMDLAKIRPLHDRILVRKIAEELGRKQPQRVILSQAEAATVEGEKTVFRGKVIAVGPGKFKKDGTRRKMDVKPGDIIWFGEHNDFEREGLVMLTEADVRGVEKN